MGNMYGWRRGSYVTKRGLSLIFIVAGLTWHHNHHHLHHRHAKDRLGSLIRMAITDSSIHMDTLDNREFSWLTSPP